MKNILCFKTMITPCILQVVFWLGALAAIVFGLIDIFVNHHYLLGVQILILGPVGLRVFVECAIIPFRIYKKLDSIVQNKS